MIRLVRPVDGVSHFDELATLQLADFRSGSAALTMDRPPTAASLKAALMSDRPAFIALLNEEPTGYGFVRTWTETGNVVVHLLDVWAAQGSVRATVEELLFSTLEDAVRSEAGVLGANCIATRKDRRGVLQRRGFTVTLDMVELEAPLDLSGTSAVPSRIVIRTAEDSDAGQIASLTARAWRDRPYFAGAPTVDQVRAWLASAERDLYLLAQHRDVVVGLASAVIYDGFVEIDDVQVDPNWQRRGIATALMTLLFNRIRERSELPVRLHTEGHDPAGALSLYERLGFQVIATHHRMRKQPTAVVP